MKPVTQTSFYDPDAPPATDRPGRRLGRVKCECEAVDPGSAAYHGGSTEGCPRDAADHSPVVTSPALCLPCLHGCTDLDLE